MSCINNFIRRLIYPNTYSSDAYINHLRKSGVKVGKNSCVFEPGTVAIDIARPYLLEIGDNVVITKGVTILTHDYSHTVIRKKYGMQYGDAKDVKIGNNVFIGRDSIILMGTTIGDNVTIYSGASILGGDTIIGDNVVVGGNAFITSSIDKDSRVSVKKPELKIVEK